MLSPPLTTREISPANDISVTEVFQCFSKILTPTSPSYSPHPGYTNGQILLLGIFLDFLGCSFLFTVLLPVTPGLKSYSKSQHLTSLINMETDIRAQGLNKPVAVAEYLFTRLYQLGIRSIHGLPGDFNLVALDYVPKANLKWVGSVNELNAGMLSAQSPFGAPPLTL